MSNSVEAGISRRKFLKAAGVLLGAGVLAIPVVKVAEVTGMIGSENEPTQDQVSAYQHLVVEQLDIIPNMVLDGSDDNPSKLRTKPYTPGRSLEQPVGKVVGKVNKAISVGDAYAVPGSNPNNADDPKLVPWLAILNPNRDLSNVPTAKDVVFSYFGNFSMTNEQELQILKNVSRQLAQ